MVVRIPATLVALALALALDVGTFMLAGRLVFTNVPIVLLPLWAAAGGFVAARWGAWPAPVPGFAIGLLIVATQIGLIGGYLPNLRGYIEPSMILLQVIAAITGGAFVPVGLWPAPYDGAYLFADVGCSKLFRLIPESGGTTAVEFATGAGNPNAMIFGPYNSTQALYYAAGGTGQIRRIAYTGTLALGEQRFLPLIRR